MRTHPYCWTVGHPHPWIANRVPGKGMSKMVSHMNPKDLLSLTKNPLKCRLPSYLKEILSLSFSLPTMEIHLSFQALPISFLPRFFFPECSKSLPSDWAYENSPWEDAPGTDEFHSTDLCIDCCYFTLFWCSRSCHRHHPIDVKMLAIAFPTAKK